jgi:dephospho-CoA kinase
MNRPSPRILLAVVGQPSSGKDTVAEYLAHKYHFKCFSTSASLRELVKRTGLGAPTRAHLGRIARELRTREGGDVLVRNAVDAAGDAQRVLVGGLRAVSEVQLVRRMGGIVIGIEAPIQLRFERAKKRGRLDDKVSFGAFQDIEKVESTGERETDQNVTALMGMADYIVVNDGSEAELFRRIDSVVARLVASL